MSETKQKAPGGNTVRWIARIWSGAVLALVVVQLMFRSPTSEPLPAVDWFLVGLWGAAVVGLLLAWRWEAGGALLTLGAMTLREVSFFLVKGFWTPAFLIIWVLVVPPAVLFLVAWMQAGRANRAPRSDESTPSGV